MKKYRMILCLVAATAACFVMGGCSIFRHHHKPAGFPRKPAMENSGPLVPEPMTMEPHPMEMHPIPMNPQ